MTESDLQKDVRAAKQDDFTKDKIIKIVEEELDPLRGAKALADGPAPSKNRPKPPIAGVTLAGVPPEEEPPQD
jgi:hypothetical protein